MSESKAVQAITDALATYRLTKLVIDDKITEDVRERVWARFGQPDESKVGYLLTCPWCVSIYAGTAVALLRRYRSSHWSTAASALAFSALTGILAERE